MNIKKASYDTVLKAAQQVEARVQNNQPVAGLQEPYLSYFYSSEYKSQIKGIFQNARQTVSRENDIIYIVTDQSEKILGYGSGGQSLDNEDYDGEIYIIFTLGSDPDFKIRDLLFRTLVHDMQNIGFRSIHVEVTKDDANTSFYIKHGATFITEITNMTDTPYKTLDYGWTDVDQII